MYVCAVYMYVCKPVCMYVCMYVREYALSISIYLYDDCTYVKSIFIEVCILTMIYVCIYVCMYVCMYVCIEEKKYLGKGF